MHKSQDVDVRQQSSIEPSSNRRFGEVGAIVLGIIAADQLTKQWALSALGVGSCSVEGNCIEVFWTLRFNLHFNPGASFSTGEGFGPWIGVISFVMAAVLITVGARSNLPLPRRIYASIAGGALGNGLDRLFRADEGVLSGKVIDFIDFQWWPIFNIADIAIVTSVLTAIAASFLFPGLMDNSAEESSADSESSQ